MKIHVAVAGPQDGRAVVLLHGWPENWWMWHKVIPALAAAGYRVHAMDLRGAGWSEVAPAGYEKEQFASDVLAAADALGLESFDLVGHDWGGWTAQLVALKAQSRIRRLVVLNIPPVWQQPGPRRPVRAQAGLPTRRRGPGGRASFTSVADVVVVHSPQRHAQGVGGLLP
ncbi:epoxide hydrolase [Mycobacteroides abscessus]|nr:epoxide hydrolase [Mycobacteroides abscessus]